METPDRNIYYFLHIDLKNKQGEDIVAATALAGLKPETDPDRDWFSGRIGELKETDTEKTVFLVHNGLIKKWFENAGDFHFEGEDNYPGGIGHLLDELRVPLTAEQVPVVPLDDFLSSKENTVRELGLYLDVMENPYPGLPPADFPEIREQQDINKIKYGQAAGTYFRDLPQDRKTPRVSLEAVRAEPSNIGYVPGASLTGEVIDSFIARGTGNEMDFAKIDPSKIADRQYIKAVETNASLIGYLPEHLRSKGIYTRAVKKDPWVLRHVPEQFRDRKIYKAAVKSMAESPYLDYMAIRLVPDARLVLGFLKGYGQKYGAYDIMREINKSQIDEKIASEAVRQDIRCISLIPEGIRINGLEGVSEQEISDIHFHTMPDPGDEGRFANLARGRRTEPVSWAAVMNDGDSLEHVPEQARSRRVIDAALRQSGESIRFIPEGKRTNEHYRTALESNGCALQYFPADRVTPANCMKAVISNPHAIGYVPVELRTREICETALGTPFDPDPFILSHIPYPDLLLEGIREYGRDHSITEILETADPKAIDRKVASYAVRKEPQALEFIPAESLNQTICNIAVKADPLLLRSVPGRFKTPELCERALGNALKEKGDPDRLRTVIGAVPYADIHCALMERFSRVLTTGDILKSIPENILNREICRKAVALQKYTKMDIPDKFKSEWMALKAFDADPFLLYNIPDRYKTRDLCVDAVIALSGHRDGYRVLSGIPYPEIICEAIKNDFKRAPAGEIVKFIPADVMDREIASEIIRRDASCLPRIPVRLKTEEVCLLAIEGTTDMEPLYAIPYDAMTEKLCGRLVEKFPRALADILPEDKRTPELCLRAVKGDESMERHVPEAIVNDRRMNMYRFGRLVDRQVSLSFGQIKDLYEGKKVDACYMEPESRTARIVQIGYNPDSRSLDYFDCAQNTGKQEYKRENIIPDKRKGLKT